MIFDAYKSDINDVVIWFAETHIYCGRLLTSRLRNLTRFCHCFRMELEVETRVILKITKACIWDLVTQNNEWMFLVSFTMIFLGLKFLHISAYFCMVFLEFPSYDHIWYSASVSGDFRRCFTRPRRLDLRDHELFEEFCAFSARKWKAGPGQFGSFQDIRKIFSIH